MEQAFRARISIRIKNVTNPRGPWTIILPKSTKSLSSPVSSHNPNHLHKRNVSLAPEINIPNDQQRLSSSRKFSSSTYNQRSNLSLLISLSICSLVAAPAISKSYHHQPLLAFGNVPRLQPPVCFNPYRQLSNSESENKDEDVDVNVAVDLDEDCVSCQEVAYSYTRWETFSAALAEYLVGRSKPASR